MSLVDSESKFRPATPHDIEPVKLWHKWMFRSIYKHRGVHIPPARSDFANETSFRRIQEADFVIRSVATHRRFIRLGTGHVGMAAGYAKEGDQVRILTGARTPFVLRKLGRIVIEGLAKKKSPQIVWTVVGECYVIGAMDGEIVDLYEEQRKEPETVYLMLPEGAHRMSSVYIMTVLTKFFFGKINVRTVRLLYGTPYCKQLGAGDEA